MRICAQIKCYHCGYVSGQICGESEGTTRWEQLRPNPTFQGELPRAGEPLRCFRCHGPVFLDEVEKQRVEPVLAAEDMIERSGRRRRQAA